MRNKLTFFITICLLIICSIAFIKVYSGLDSGHVKAAIDADTNGNNERNDSSISEGLASTGGNADTSDNAAVDLVTINNFELEIPAINLKKKVYPNVNPSDKKEYLAVLEKGIAHGKYTKLPSEATESGNVYLFAHHEGYANGKDIGFFKKLDNLKSGDDAIIHFNGNTYVYNFRSSKIVDPSDTTVYTAEALTPTLTLQTCHNGEKQRLIATFDLVGWY